ncbi:uncharacterized protein [Dermacentor andersoni]|uniref:uncharacterized protein n=1 Tax=Dermacentor andersoni TaxID=34620 RepID=UPI003B3B47FA
MCSWSDDEVFYFVSLVEQFPALWDSSRNDYNDNAKKRYLWNKVAGEMNENYLENGPYEVDVLKGIFANKRRTYRKEKKKVRTTTSGQPASEVYTGKWIFFAAMRFLDAVPEPNHRFCSGDYGSSASSAIEPHHNRDILAPAEQSGGEEGELSVMLEESSSTNSPTTSRRVESPPTLSTKRPRQLRSSGPSSEDWVQRQAVLHSIASAMQQPSEPNDASFFFAKTIAAHMRQLDAVKQVQCQKEILDTVEKFLTM